MNEIEMARFCEAALVEVERTWEWGWRHHHADGTICYDRRVVYEVHPDDWSAAEVATFNAAVRGRVGEAIVMRHSSTLHRGVAARYLQSSNRIACGHRGPVEWVP